MIAGMEEIERVVVVGEGDGVAAVAREYDMEIANIPVQSKIDLPFTHDETMELVRRVAGAYPIRDESLVVVDHRNLLLTDHDLRQAIAVHREQRGAMVISVAPCQDHPCQYRAYFNYLGCEIVRFQKERRDQVSGEDGLDVDVKICVKNGYVGDITLRVQGTDVKPALSFHLEPGPSQGIVVQVLPYTAKGPLYDEQLEMFIDDPESRVELESRGQELLAGLIVTLLQPSMSGSYDTVEFFTPRNASWGLSGGGCAVEKDGFAPILGRQQFVPVYAYDGSVCMVNAHQVGKGALGRVVPYVLQEAGFVMDWVDYWGQVENNKRD